MKLEYVTKENADPSTLPGILFACHPRDFDLYFDEISEKLMETAPCAVWYAKKACNVKTDDGSGADAGAARAAGTVEDAELSSMRLIVIVVTTRLLTTKNDCMDDIWPRAEKLHIRVLCVMAERCLAGLTMGKFGAATSRLSLHPLDVTRIPFEEGLSRVLHGALGERNGAFTYLISRDVKIILDKAVGFNADKEKDLKSIYWKTRLDDRTSKKTIALSIKLEQEYDEDKLWDFFCEKTGSGQEAGKGTEPVPEQNASGGEEEPLDEEWCILFWVALNLAIEAQNLSGDIRLSQDEYYGTEHRFEYALEDFQKSLKLAGRLCELAEYLSSGSFGQGQPSRMDSRQTDYRKVSRERRVSAALNTGLLLAVTDQPEKACEVLAEVKEDLDIFGCYVYAGALAEAGRLEDAREFYVKALEQAEGSVRKSGTVYDRRWLGLCHRNLGFFYSMTAEEEKALHHFLEAMKIFEVLYWETEAFEDASYLASCLEELGCREKDSRKAGRFAFRIGTKAREYDAEAYKLRRRCLEIRRDGLYAASKTYDRYTFEERFPKDSRARRTAEQFRDTLNRLGEPDPEKRKFLWIGDLLLEYGDNSSMEHWFGTRYPKVPAFRALRDALEEYTDLLLQEEPLNMGVNKKIRRAFERVLIISEHLAQSVQAPEDVQADKRIRGKLAAYESQPDYSELWEALKSGGKVPKIAFSKYPKELDDMWTEYQKYLDQIEKTGNKDAWATAIRKVISVYMKMGAACRKELMLKNSQGHYYKACTLGERLCEKTGAKDFENLALSYYRYGVSLNIYGGRNESVEYFRKAMELGEKLLAEDGVKSVRKLLLLCYKQLGSIDGFRHNHSGAKEYYKKGVIYCEELYEEQETPAICEDLAWFCYKVGVADQAAIEKDYLQRSLDLYRRVVNSDPWENKEAQAYIPVLEKYLKEACD